MKIFTALYWWGWKQHSLVSKWLFGIMQDPVKSQYLTMGNRCRVCPKITVCLCWEVPEVHRDDGRTPAAPRRSLASRNLAALPNAASVCAPACSALLPGSAPTGRTHSRIKPAGGGGGFAPVIPRVGSFFFFCPDSCWSGRGQIRRRWHREIPGIPVFVVRNVALTDKTAAETRNALQADGAGGSSAEFWF